MRITEDFATHTQETLEYHILWSTRGIPTTKPALLSLEWSAHFCTWSIHTRLRPPNHMSGQNGTPRTVKNPDETALVKCEASTIYKLVSKRRQVADRKGTRICLLFGGSVVDRIPTISKLFIWHGAGFVHNRSLRMSVLYIHIVNFSSSKRHGVGPSILWSAHVSSLTGSSI